MVTLCGLISWADKLIQNPVLFTRKTDYSLLSKIQEVLLELFFFFPGKKKKPKLSNPKGQ